MPISSGALGWPRSHWSPPPKFDPSRNRIVYPATEWAMRRAKELKRQKLVGRRKRKKLMKIKHALTQINRRKLRHRCLIVFIVLIILVLIGAAGFLVYWFIWKGKPNC